jgi:predicted nuclease of predicted toxin-antitoxin system
MGLRFLLDEHMPKPLLRFLLEQGFEAVLSTRTLGFGTSDRDIATWADDNHYIVVTKDLDFKRSHLNQGSPRRVIRLMIGNCSSSETVTMFAGALPEILALESSELFVLEVY